MTSPTLLKALDRDQKLRLLALDYVTATGFVPPEDWCRMARQLEDYLKTGSLGSCSTATPKFPNVVKME